MANYKTELSSVIAIVQLSRRFDSLRLM